MRYIPLTERWIKFKTGILELTFCDFPGGLWEDGDRMFMEKVYFALSQFVCGGFDVFAGITGIYFEWIAYKTMTFYSVTSFCLFEKDWRRGHGHRDSLKFIWGALVN